MSLSDNEGCISTNNIACPGTEPSVEDSGLPGNSCYKQEFLGTDLEDKKQQFSKYTFSYIVDR